MRKFSKILESADSDIVLDIRDILMEFKDAGFRIEVEDWSKGPGFVDVRLKTEEKTDTMDCVRDLSVADERIKDLGLSYEDSTIEINHNGANIKMRYKLVDSVANKDVHGWKEFKAYCEKVLGIDGIEGADTFDSYFRINVVDKDSGWPGVPDDKAGWSIDIDDIGPNTFAAAFPGYEDFLKKLLSRQINYNLVWHLCSDEGDRGHYISDPGQLAEANKNHNPMKFDKEGIEAVETLVEMAEKFPEKIEIKKHNI